jgi:hypothetical protein
MQRSISHKNNIAPYIYVALFLVYTSLSGIYLFLPPLLAVLFFLFRKALDREDTTYVVIVSLCLVLFEAENGYTLFSTIIYFTIIYKYVVPRISKNFGCQSCINFMVVSLVYFGFFIFNSLLTSVFFLPEPNISYYIIYYIIIEFFIVSML